MYLVLLVGLLGGNVIPVGNHENNSREGREDKFKDVRTAYNDVQLLWTNCALYEIIH